MRKTGSKLAILFVVGFVVFAASLSNEFVWEDESLIVNNPVVHSLKNAPQLIGGGTYFNHGLGRLEGELYRPLMMFYFSVVYSVFGSSPFYFHLLQALIHIVNSFLVFLLLRKHLREETSFLLSLVFLVHPLNVEAVSYVAITNDVLFFLFGMLALRSERTLAVAILLLLSLLSKETGALFCVPLLFMGRVAAVGIAGGAYWLLKSIFAAHQEAIVDIFPLANIPFWERMLNVPKIVLFYLRSFFFPIDLSVGRGWIVEDLDFADFFLPLLVLALVIAGFAHVLRKHRSRELVFFLFWLSVGIGAHLHVLPLSMTVADRWFYFPMVGALGICGLALDRLDRTKLVAVAVICVIAVFAVIAFRRSLDFRSNESLFSHDIAVSPDGYLVQGGIGVVKARQGRFSEAKGHFEEAIRLNPHEAAFYNDLALVYENLGQNERAIEVYHRSLAVQETPAAYERLVTLLRRNGNSEAAAEVASEGLKTFPFLQFRE